jgi:hypothetical protein
MLWLPEQIRYFCEADASATKNTLNSIRDFIFISTSHLYMSTSDLDYRYRRIQIFKNEYLDSDITNEYAIFDTVVDAEFGVARLLDDGTWECEVWYAMQSIPFTAATIQEVARLSYDYLVNTILHD